MNSRKTQTYLIRSKNTKYLIGIFTELNLKDLYWSVDECLDPNECEYAVVHHGGIFWSGNWSEQNKEPFGLNIDWNFHNTYAEWQEANIPGSEEPKAFDPNAAKAFELSEVFTMGMANLVWRSFDLARIERHPRLQKA